MTRSGKVVPRGFPRVRFLAEKKAGAVKVNVGQVQPHGAALGNVPRFIQVGPRGRRRLLPENAAKLA